MSIMDIKDVKETNPSVIRVSYVNGPSWSPPGLVDAFTVFGQRKLLLLGQDDRPLCNDCLHPHPQNYETTADASRSGVMIACP
jgi:hypothetical protein